MPSPQPSGGARPPNSPSASSSGGRQDGNDPPPALALIAFALSVLLLLGPWLEAPYGLVLRLVTPSLAELQLLALVLTVGSLASLLPGYRAYRLSLADGLTPRV